MCGPYSRISYLPSTGTSLTCVPDSEANAAEFGVRLHSLGDAEQGLVDGRHAQFLGHVLRLRRQGDGAIEQVGRQLVELVARQLHD